MNRTGIIAVSFMLLVIAGACQRRPLTVMDNSVYIDIDVDLTILNEDSPEVPELMRVIFYDQESGDMRYEFFLPPEGGMVDVYAGEYDVMVYNFGTETTIVENEEDISTICAYTNEPPSWYLSAFGTKSEDGGYVFQPDYLYVGRENGVTVPVRSEGVEYIEVPVEADNIVESWILELKGVKGAEYISGYSCSLTCVAAGNYIATDTFMEQHSTLLIEVGAEHITEDGFCQHFTTFGCHDPHSLGNTLTVAVTDTGGETHVYEYEVKDQFHDNPTQRITVQADDIVIEKPDKSGGGFDPDVDDWDDEDIDIEI